MATKSKGRTSTAKPATMRQQINRPGGQARMRRSLANIRQALGDAGVSRAMKNWGLRASKSSGKGGARGGRGAISARNG